MLLVLFGMCIPNTITSQHLGKDYRFLNCFLSILFRLNQVLNTFVNKSSNRFTLGIFVWFTYSYPVDQIFLTGGQTPILNKFYRTHCKYYYIVISLNTII